MANNKVSSLFNIDLPTPKRSNFNLGRVNRFSADVGYVIPCYVEEVLPNSYKRLDVDALIQTNATIAPLMGSFKVKIDAFFVPLRLYHRHLDLNNTDIDFDDNFDFHYIDTPIFEIESSLGGGKSISVAPGSLFDYLGIMPAGFNSRAWNSSFRLNATPFIGYFDIWRNFYSNPHDRFVPFRVQNVPFEESNLPVWFPSSPSYTKRVNIECFDDFITRINSSSISSSGNPLAVDAFTAFCEKVQVDHSDVPSLNRLQTYANTMPLYQGQINGTPSSNTSLNITDLVDTSNGLHFGLLPRTYMDDYFNSRFMNDFVQYMEEQSVVSVENNQFSITQLRLANRIAKYVDKSIFSDTRFGSWIKAHFGVKTSQKLNIPQFLGSITSNIVFNDIYASAQTAESASVTANTALGSRASLGQGFIKNKGSFVEFKATEPGYLLCMFSIIPYVSYTQGIRKLYLKNSFNDLYRPEYDAVGYQDLQRVELDAIVHSYPSGIPSNVTTVSLGPDTWNHSIGKHPAWIEYMTAFDEAHGLMTSRYEYGSWVLNRPYAPGVYDGTDIEVTRDNLGNITAIELNDFFGSMDVSTYINAEYFNTIFAVNKWYDNFQVQMRFYDKTKQPMSKQILPHL